MIGTITDEIKKSLKENAPALTQDQRSRMYKILNSKNPNFICHGLKVSEIENIVKAIYNKFECSYQDAIGVFKELMKSDVNDEQFSAILFIDRYKRNFNGNTIKLFHDELAKYCSTWALCDSSMIRLGSFLGKKCNEKLARETIQDWSNDKNMWVRRASIVILLKIIMVKREFDKEYVFAFVEKMLQYPEDYVQKGIGWLLKTCSKHEPELIFNYLKENKKALPRLILRYASEKLSKEKRAQVLKN